MFLAHSVGSEAASHIAGKASTRMVFPADAVDTYLRRHLSDLGALRSVRKFDIGQSNPTYRLTMAHGHCVLRAKPTGNLLKSAHAIEREFRILQALQGSSVPVPRPLHYCEDESVLGSAFYVMEYVPGNVHVDATLACLDATVRMRIYQDSSRLLAALNEIDLQAARIEDYARPEGYWARLVKRWTEQYRAAETDTRPAVEALICALPRAVPSVSYTPSLVHGDFRLDNFVIDEGGKIRAVLDWELSTLGCPYADLAWQCAQWRLPAGDMRGLAGVDRRALGIPTEEEYVAEYCARRGIPGIPHWNFYLAASLFRLAGICQGIYRRGVEGNASSSEALGFGHKTDVVADLAINILTDPHNA
jgi:aminoglycoside phosphotransferase (APT) family kinase protein